MEPQIKQLDKNGLRMFNDHLGLQKKNNIYVNNNEAFNTVINNKGTSYKGITDFDGSYVTDLAKTGDYTLGQLPRYRVAGIHITLLVVILIIIH